MVVQVAEIVTVARADLTQFEAKMNRHDRRIEESTRKSQRAGRGGAFRGAAIGGAVGGVAGFAAGSVMGSEPVNKLGELVGNLIIAALLPVIHGLLPVLKALQTVFESPAFQSLIGWLTRTVTGTATGIANGADIATGNKNPTNLQDIKDLALFNTAAGAAGGAVAGGIAGSIIPGAGTAVGAGGGALVGAGAGLAATGIEIATNESMRGIVSNGAGPAGQQWWDSLTTFWDSDVAPSVGSNRRAMWGGWG